MKKITDECGNLQDYISVFVIGAKGLLNYGGYETFLNKLTEHHQDHPHIKYHVACKLNGPGAMDETKLEDVRQLSDTEFIYHNAHCFKLRSPELGSAQAVFYDIAALNYCCGYIKKHHIKNAIVYVLSSRVGVFMGYYAKKIHKLGGKYWNNPDGRENLRKKYRAIIRQYWKISEQFMVKHSDLVICDSQNIEKYIQKEYKSYNPKTTFIAYGADLGKSKLADDDPKYIDWLKKHGLKPLDFYISVGRFVPENNFETMIREFISSKSERCFAIITTANERFLNKLEEKVHFKKDPRIKFVGTVYDQELLKKIRENAYGYFHGHEVGGTNPSLLESLASTNINLLFDVGFNQEVGKDGALYWTKETGNLAKLIEKADSMQQDEINVLANKAKKRILDEYSWDHIADLYEKIFLENSNVLRGGL